MQTTQEQQKQRTSTEIDTEVFFSLIGLYIDYDAGEWTEEDFTINRELTIKRKTNSRQKQNSTKYTRTFWRFYRRR